MVYKEESLLKLLILIDEVCSEPEYLWFKQKLINQLGDSKVHSKKNNGDFGSYFNLLKKQFKIKANKFYESIKDQNLKKQLVADCIKMYWYQVNNDINQLFVYAFFQMENLLNYYLAHSNPYEKVRANKNFYTHYFNERFIVACSTSFFVKEDRKKISAINMWPKIVYWAYDSNRVDFLETNNSNISNLVNIRNENSHRNSGIVLNENSGNNFSSATIDYLKSADFTSFGFYTKILKEIIKSIDEIKKDVEIKPFQFTKVSLPKPKIVGHVDLNKIKK